MSPATTETASAASGLIVDDLDVRYGPIHAVRAVKLALRAGEILAVLGVNGAGKSSLLNAVTGLVKPSAGRIVVDGRDMTRWPTDRRVRGRVNLVPEGRRIFPHLSVREHLLLGIGRNDDGQEILDEVVTLFPVLADRLGSMAGTLSGGQQQQLVLARALVTRPRYLLLDEPSLGLSPQMIDVIFDTVNRLRRQGLGILLVEQNADRAAALADRVMVMEHGELSDSDVGSLNTSFGFVDAENGSTA